MKGYVYILTNPYMPKLVKVGHTRRTVEKRVKELNGKKGYLPAPYEIAYKLHTYRYIELENQMKQELGEYRLPRREFFEYPLEDTISLLQQLWQDRAGTEKWTLFHQVNIHQSEKEGLIDIFSSYFTHLLCKLKMLVQVSDDAQTLSVRTQQNGDVELYHHKQREPIAKALYLPAGCEDEMNETVPLVLVGNPAEIFYYAKVSSSFFDYKRIDRSKFESELYRILIHKLYE